MKTCSKCKIGKNSTDFHKYNKAKDKLKSWCKDCCLEHKRNNPDNYRNSLLKCDYGITLKDYNSILVSQNNSCAICNRDASLFKKRLSVDHNHKTGTVRGLLCSSCNGVLGRFKDDPQLFISAANYLSKEY